jgi:trans-aconitate 2-methyltransferase
LGFDSSKEMILPGRAGLEGFIRTTWLPITSKVPEELRPQLMWEISDRDLKTPPLRDGFARVNMPVLLVEAMRPE